MFRSMLRTVPEEGCWGHMQDRYRVKAIRKTFFPKEASMSAVENQTDNEQQNPAETAALVPKEARPAIPQWEIDDIIRKRVYGSAALGMAPIPLLDLVGLYAIQLDLVRALAKKYGVPFSADRVKTLISALVGSVLPVSLVPIVASLAKLIPVIGWTTSASSMSLVGGASTYALGRVFARHFATGGSLLHVDTEKMKDSFKETYEDGKKFVKKLGKKSAPEAAAPDTVEPQTAV